MPVNLYDQIEIIHLQLYDDPKYRALRSALWDEQAVEGSIAMDDACSALMVRDYARKNTHTHDFVARQTLAAIVKALDVVERRYGESRKRRRRRFAEEQAINVPPGGFSP